MSPGRIMKNIPSLLMGCLLASDLSSVRAEERSSATTATVLFVCPHNAAKSIIAASHFNRLARERGLAVGAVSAGTHPADTVSTAVVALLRKDGMDVSNEVPRMVTADELSTAARIVSLGCEDLESSITDRSKYESWDDVPPPINDLPGAHAKIRSRVETLVSKIQEQEEK